MDVIFNLAEKFVKPFISINAQKENRELVQLSVEIDQLVNNMTIIGCQNERQIVVPFYQIIRFYTQDKHVVCETVAGTYQVRQRMYELREQLSESTFIAVSNAEIVNKTAIKSFSLTNSGSYQIHLTTGATTYTSRRYVHHIKETFLK